MCLIDVDKLPLNVINNAIPIEVLQEIRQEIEQLRQPTIPNLINYAAVFNEGVDTALNIIDTKIAEYTGNKES